MAPAPKTSDASSQSSSGWFNWGAKKQVRVAHLPDDREEPSMYYNKELKKWVEKGKEAEAANDPGSAPPPTFAMLNSSSTDLSRISAPGPTSAPLATLPPGTKKAVSKRYVLQSNLSVSSSMASMTELGVGGGQVSPSISTSTSFTSLVPPAGPTNGAPPPTSFFMPTPPSSTNEGDNKNNTRGFANVYASSTKKFKGQDAEPPQADGCEEKAGLTQESAPPPSALPPALPQPPFSAPGQFFVPPSHSPTASVETVVENPETEPAQDPVHAGDANASSYQNYFPPGRYNQTAETEPVYNAQSNDQHSQGYYYQQEQSNFSSASYQAHDHSEQHQLLAAHHPPDQLLAAHHHPPDQLLAAHHHYPPDQDAPVMDPPSAPHSINYQGSSEGSASLHSWGRINSQQVESAPPSHVGSLHHPPLSLPASASSSSAHIPNAYAPPPPPPPTTIPEHQASSVPLSAPLLGLHSKGKELFGSVLSNIVPKGLIVMGGGGGGGTEPWFANIKEEESVEDDFDLAMHPGRAGKLDGPLPWELPDDIKFSDRFVSTCTSWQRHNPGAVYRRPGQAPADGGGPGQAPADGGGVQEGRGEHDQGSLPLPLPLPLPNPQAHMAPVTMIQESHPHHALEAALTHPLSESTNPDYQSYDRALHAGLIQVNPSTEVLQDATTTQDGWDFEGGHTSHIEDVQVDPEHKDEPPFPLSDHFHAPHPGQAHESSSSMPQYQQPSVTHDSYQQPSVTHDSYQVPQYEYEQQWAGYPERQYPVGQNPEGQYPGGQYPGVTNGSTSHAGYYASDGWAVPPPPDQIDKTFPAYHNNDEEGGDPEDGSHQWAPPPPRPSLPPPLPLPPAILVSSIENPSSIGLGFSSQEPPSPAQSGFGSSWSPEGFGSSWSPEYEDQEGSVSFPHAATHHPQAPHLTEATIPPPLPFIPPPPPPPPVDNDATLVLADAPQAPDPIVPHVPAPAPAPLIPSEAASSIHDVLNSVREQRPVPEETLEAALALLQELEEMRRRASSEAALFSPLRGGGGSGAGPSTDHGSSSNSNSNVHPQAGPSSSSSHYTPIKAIHQDPSASSSVRMEEVAAQMEHTMLQTPQRAAPPPSPYYRTQESPGGGSTHLLDPSQQGHDTYLSMSVEERLEALRRELTADFEAQISAQARALRDQFEAQLEAVRRELTSEYEAKLAARDAELEEQRERCAGLQDDLDQLLLCLGQEGRKVESLEEAMRKAGLDPDPITQPIDDEYAAMDN